MMFMMHHTSMGMGSMKMGGGGPDMSMMGPPHDMGMGMIQHGMMMGGHQGMMMRPSPSMIMSHGMGMMDGYQANGGWP